jgi:hypothetical protein
MSDDKLSESEITSGGAADDRLSNFLGVVEEERRTMRSGKPRPDRIRNSEVQITARTLSG